MLNIAQALVLAPRANDGELGCGGTLARLVEQGTTVYYVAFSICEASTSPSSIEVTGMRT